MVRPDREPELPRGGEAGGGGRLPEGENPLLSPAPDAWDRLIEAVGPAALLVVISSKMGNGLKRSLTPEDIWQEALLHAWRDRRAFEWRGVRSFRGWLLEIIANRIRDAADHRNAMKRGEKLTRRFSSAPGLGGHGGSASELPLAAGSTTPSRVAIHKEQAEAMTSALERLPEELRAVVHMRLFEEMSLPEISRRLGITLPTAKHRFRKGAEIYRRHLLPALAERTRAEEEPSPRAP